MWYIWKARNDLRFNNKKWTVWQVHNSVAAEINISQSDLQVTENTPETTTQTRQDAQQAHSPFLSHNQGTQTLIAGTQEEQEQLNDQASELPGPPLFRVQVPARLPGMRCYTDASTAPDTPMQVSRHAGLGVFIVDNRSQPPTTRSTSKQEYEKLHRLLWQRLQLYSDSLSTGHTRPILPDG